MKTEKLNVVSPGFDDGLWHILYAARIQLF